MPDSLLEGSLCGCRLRALRIENAVLTLEQGHGQHLMVLVQHLLLSGRQVLPQQIAALCQQYPCMAFFTGAAQVSH